MAGVGAPSDISAAGAGGGWGLIVFEYISGAGGEFLFSNAAR